MQIIFKSDTMIKNTKGYWNGKKEKLKRCHLQTYTIIKDLSKRRIEYDILALKWLFKKQLKLKNS